MSTLEIIVIIGFIGVIICLDGIQKDIRKLQKQNQNSEFDPVVTKLKEIESRLKHIEAHTARVAEPLYDQDAFDREHLVGKYAPPM